jgi:hypothetical protein
LDIIRTPERAFSHCVEPATELIALSSNVPLQCSLVVASVIRTEWSDHDQNTLESLERYLRKMEAQSQHFHALSKHLGIGLSFGLPSYEMSGLASQLHNLSRNLLDASISIDPDNTIKTRAYDRVVATKKRPSTKGGELKDCTIFEEYLEVCRQLNTAGFSRKMVFCTSNTDDYCSPAATPHADIATDCLAVGGLIFTTNLSWALAVVKKG